MNKMTTKNLRQIAESNGYSVDIYRHGCYTNYRIKKGNTSFMVELISNKETKHYTIASKGDFKHETSFEIVKNWEGDSCLASGKMYAKLSLEDVESILILNA